MDIDLNTTEGRKQYLSDKLDDLLEGINMSYGTVLMKELLNRLELTIKDFNDEIKVLCDGLIQKEEERQHLLEMLKCEGGLAQGKDAKEPNVDSALSNIISSEEENDIPVWEKKLAKLEKK